jgi:hypothetical protein
MHIAPRGQIDLSRRQHVLNSSLPFQIQGTLTSPKSGLDTFHLYARKYSGPRGHVRVY